MKTRAVILAGGEGSRLGVLTVKRTKPAVLFAGKYRIIDFTLSNCVNSGVFDVMLLTQYRPHSLIEHIGVGRPWDLDRSLTGGVQIYQPYKDRHDSTWYRGSADAVHQNFSFVKRGGPDLILILSGDHIYQMDYDPMIEFHLDHEADLTIATLRVNPEETHRFGILDVDAEYRVREFIEKPTGPSGTLASMGIYIFQRDALRRAMQTDAQQPDSTHDFGTDIMPRMVAGGARVFAFPYSGYWVDVGTLETYWQAHMDLLGDPPRFDLNDRSWVVHTKSEERPPAMIHSGAVVRDSLIADGAIIRSGAVVERSVLSPGVHVGPGAHIRQSIILTDAHIAADAQIEKAVLDKIVRVGERSRIGAKSAAQITTIGKAAKLPPETVVAPGAEIPADTRPEAFLTDPLSPTTA